MLHVNEDRSLITLFLCVQCVRVRILQGGPKSKPLPNYHKYRIKACQWD